MHTGNRFETPENVQIQYETAGLGTRFLAWFVDQILIMFLMVAVAIILIAAGASYYTTVEEMFDEDPTGRIAFYLVGFMLLVWGLGSFAYFGLCEFLWRGQTPGKRMLGIRVVTAEGFQLDAAAILVRNIFRVLDHMPPMWIVPLLSGRHQRAGDMVAGTVVISDATEALSAARRELSARSAAEAEFRFDYTKLSRLSSGDFEAVERILERLHGLPAEQQGRLVGKVIESLARKMQMEQPPPERQVRFLEDLLAAEFRRQDRAIG